MQVAGSKCQGEPATCDLQPATYYLGLGIEIVACAILESIEFHFPHAPHHLKVKRQPSSDLVSVIRMNLISVGTNRMIVDEPVPSALLTTFVHCFPSSEVSTS